MRVSAIAALCFAMLALAPAWAQKILGPTEFRDRIAQAVSGLSPSVCVRAVDDYTLRFGPSEAECEGFINIDNGYRDYLAAPANLDAIVQRYLPIAAQIVNGPVAETNERERLVVVLRPRSYEQSVPAGALVARPFLGDLMAVLMLDSPTHLTSITHERLAELSLSDDQAFELAAKNLRTRLGLVDRTQERGIEVIGAVSALISGTLWLGDGCTSNQEERLALLAGREYYFATDGRDADQRNFFLGFARHLIGQGDSISNTVLVCRSGHWIVYGPSL